MSYNEKIIYTPIGEAAEIIAERRADEALQARLESLIGNSPLPDVFTREKSAILAEYVARPTGTDLSFAEQAAQAGLQPGWLSYTGDIFTNANAKKVDMWRPRLALPKGQDMRSWIVAPAERTAKIGEAPTVFDNNMNVAKYWAGLRKAEFSRYGISPLEDAVSDATTWYRQQAERRGEVGSSIAAGYYPAVMGVYATKAVLFCDFDKYPDFYPIALEAYTTAADTLGVNPVIVAFDGSTPRESADGRRLLQASQTDLTWIAPDQTANLLNEGKL